MNTAKREDDRAERGRDEPVRRRQRSTGDVTGTRLAVDMSTLDEDNFAYRWINDTDLRMYAKTKKDDWSIVTNTGGVVKDDSSDLGAAVSYPVGVAADGSSLKAYLCRKPRKFHEDDKKAARAALDEQLEQLKRGQSREGQPEYVPTSGISIAPGR